MRWQVSTAVVTLGVGMSELRAYEGLVIKTASLYSRRLGMESEDLQQVLRVKIWQALEAHDPGRSDIPVRRYVFRCVTNQIKDLIKARVRAVERKDWLEREVGLPLLVEDFSKQTFNGSCEDAYERDEVHLPDTLDDTEREVIGMLYVGYRQREIAEMLVIKPYKVDRILRGLRVKLEDWRPSVTGDADLIQLEVRVRRAVTRLAA